MLLLDTKHPMSAARTAFAMCGERSGDAILKSIFRAPTPIKLVGAVWTPPSTKDKTNDDDARLAQVPVLFDGPKELGVMGAGMDLLKALPNAGRRLHQTVRAVISTRPDVLLTVDSKGFSLRLQDKVASSRPQIKRIHLCAPSIWAYKDGIARAAKSTLKLDCLGTVLPFEPFYWKRAGRGDGVKFVGYFAVETLLDAVGHEDADLDDNLVKDVLDKQEMANDDIHHKVDFPHQVPLPTFSSSIDKLPRIPAGKRESGRLAFARAHFADSLTHDDPILVLAPGSRVHVVKSSLAVMRDLINHLHSKNHKRRFGICILNAHEPRLDPFIDEFVKYVRSTLNLPVAVVNERDKASAFLAAKAAFVVSGTIVTELQLFQVPTVVMYNAGGFLTEYMARRMAQVSHVSLSNILSGQALCPEFLFSQCENTRKIATEVEQRLFEWDETESRVSSERVLAFLDRLVLYANGKPIRPSSVARHLIVHS